MYMFLNTQFKYRPQDITRVVANHDEGPLQFREQVINAICSRGNLMMMMMMMIWMII